MKTQLYAAAPRLHTTARKGVPEQPHFCMGSLLLFLSILLLAQPAYSMSWSWTPLADKGVAPAASPAHPASERLSFTLDNPGQVRRLVRSGTNTLLLYLDGPAPDLQRQGSAPARGALLESVGVSNGQVRITLSS